ncbi:putative RNA splicing factor [Tieghemostelium lacteum]|uniref:Putative RNA splicing factor n=1 Tax=Tieghemostelium lacteum TaxID=361077 RepID=A0A151Z615_TIELA|nr:putative RNA splicing factor [Tieghemostelium lacteum]|eukprot:KYQ89399.1 putative RNA splicing factor [Tieghemostelium lacteum]
MESRSFFRGTSAEQDDRFTDKDKKLLKSTKFPSSFNQKVDTSKVHLPSIKRWINKKIQTLLADDDEFLVDYICELLEKNPDPKIIQIYLTGFLEKDTADFMNELWDLLLEAQTSVGGIPKQFFEDIELASQKAKEEEERIKAAINKTKIKVESNYTQQPQNDNIVIKTESKPTYGLQVGSIKKEEGTTDANGHNLDLKSKRSSSSNGSITHTSEITTDDRVSVPEKRDRDYRDRDYRDLKYSDRDYRDRDYRDRDYRDHHHHYSSKDRDYRDYKDRDYRDHHYSSRDRDYRDRDYYYDRKDRDHYDRKERDSYYDRRDRDYEYKSGDKRDRDYYYDRKDRDYDRRDRDYDHDKRDRDYYYDKKERDNEYTSTKDKDFRGKDSSTVDNREDDDSNKKLKYDQEEPKTPNSLKSDGDLTPSPSN